MRRYSASDAADIPFLNTSQLREHSTVQVTQDSTSPFQAGNPFGWYRTRRRSTMYKLDDGALVMTDEHTYTGLACALVPTHERSEVVLTLNRGSCAPRS